MQSLKFMTVQWKMTMNIFEKFRNDKREFDIGIDDIFDIIKKYDSSNHFDKYYNRNSELEFDYEFGKLVSLTLNFDNDDYSYKDNLSIPIQVFDSTDETEKWFKAYFKSVERDKNVKTLIQTFKSMSKVKDIDFLYDAIECIKAGDTDQETIYGLIEKYTK